MTEDEASIVTDPNRPGPPLQPDFNRIKSTRNRDVLVQRTNRGQITKLKPVKRQIYGRAKLDLLQVRLIGAT